MKLALNKNLLFAMAAAVVLSACGSAPTKSDAISLALQEEAMLRDLAAECQKVSKEARVAAYNARKNWWKRNGAIVKASDSLLVNNSTFVFGDRELPAAQALIRVTTDVREIAESYAAEVTNASDKEKACLNELEKYDSGELDLAKDKTLQDTYIEIQNQAKSDYQGISAAKVKVAKDRSYGRSLFVVEAKLKDRGCQSPKVALLRNSWPLEVYDAQCSDKSYFLVRCQWGKCKVF